MGYLIKSDVINAIQEDKATSLMCYDDQATRDIINFCYESMEKEIDALTQYKVDSAAEDETRAKEYYKLGEDATLIISIGYEYDKKTAYYDNTPTVEISSGHVGLGVSLDKEHKRHDIIMTLEQAKAVIKALKMQIKRLKK